MECTLWQREMFIGIGLGWHACRLAVQRRRDKKLAKTPNKDRTIADNARNSLCSTTELLNQTHGEDRTGKDSK